LDEAEHFHIVEGENVIGVFDTDPSQWPMAASGTTATEVWLAQVRPTASLIPAPTCTSKHEEATA